MVSGFMVDDAIVFANLAAVNLFGAQDEAELVGEHLNRFLLPEDQNRIKQLHSKVQTGQDFPWREEKRVRLDGSVFDVEASSIPVLWDGEPAIVSIARDITEKKRAEESLQRSEMEASRARQQLLDAIEAIPDGFVLFDENDRLVLCNSVYRGMYPGLEADIVPGVIFEGTPAHSVRKA